LIATAAAQVRSASDHVARDEEDELSEISGVIHDAWFDVEAVAHDAAER
jgi:hypothetical protein